MSAQPYPVDDTRREIVFVRHAESQANLDGIWNGRTDGELSAAGEESLEALARRLSTWEFDAVLSSPLSRARRTAGVFSDEVVLEDDLIEILLTTAAVYLSFIAGETLLSSSGIMAVVGLCSVGTV